MDRLIDKNHQSTPRNLKMKTLIKFSTILLVALLALLPLQQAAAASGTFDGQVIFGQSFTLKSGETMNGDLLVFGGSATIEEGAAVNGSTVLFGGNLTVNGEVNGDVAVTGGTVTLGSAAHITGNLTTVAASLERADGSRVDGQVYNTATSWAANGDNTTTVVPPKVPVPIVPPTTWVNRFLSFHIPDPLNSVLNAFTQAIGMALLAMLVMLFLSTYADRVAHTIITQPVTAGGLGLLTVIAAPFAIVLTALTIILIPVSLVIAFALIVAGVFGWLVVGYEIGKRFTKAIHQNWHPAFSAGAGVFALTLVAKALTGIPVLNCVGWLVPVVMVLAALGAVVMTRFGMQMVAAPAETSSIAPTNSAGQNPAS
jgi:cytoskeletal protein CcmA (bactofilin family)